MRDQLPPISLEAEQSVLGAMLIDGDAVVQVADFLHAEDFYRQAHQVIYAALLELYEQGMPVDIVTVAEVIERNGDIDRIGGRAYLASLSTDTPTAVHVEAYGKIVRRKAVLRRLIGAAGRIASIAYADPEDYEAAVDAATEEVYKVSDTRSHAKYKDLKSLLHVVYDKIDQIHSDRDQVTGIRTGLGSLDVMTHGFQSSDLIILAARPSVGKSSFALNVAEHAAGRQNKKVGLFSLEMSDEQLVMRLLSSESGVDSQRLRSGFMEEGDFTRIANTMNLLSESLIYIDDSASLTINELRTKARRMKAEVGIDLVIIDYLQLMQAPGSAGRDSNRVQEVSAISRGLKQLARELEVPVLALSQLNRLVEERQGGEPRLADLRESGSIEQDADVVLFLWRPPGARNEEDTASTEGEWINLKVAKHRNGPTGDLQLWFRRSLTRFYEQDDAR